MLSLKLFLTISLLQILATAAPLLPRQGPIEIFPVEGGGNGILNTLVGPSETGIYTEIQRQPIEGHNVQELEEELENTRVGPLNGEIVVFEDGE
jgi:hypothetical protein